MNRDDRELQRDWQRGIWEACREVARAVYSEMPLEQACELIALNFQKATGLPWITIGLIDHEAQVVRYPSQQFARTGFTMHVWPLKVSLCADVVAAGEPVVIADTDPRLVTHPLRKVLDRCWVHLLPVYCEGSIKAVLVVAASEPLIAEELEDCVLLASFLSDCMEILAQQKARNRDLARLAQRLKAEIQERVDLHMDLLEREQELRALSTRLSNVQEEERAHLVRELHDELGQLLTAALMNLSVLKPRLGSDEESTRLLEESSSLIYSTVESFGRLARRLRPPLLESLGLPTALAHLVTEYERRTGLNCTLECRLGYCLNDPSSLALFRTVKRH